MSNAHAKGIAPDVRSLLLPRLLPVRGRVLVQSGELVSPEQVLAESDLSPGVRWTVPASEQLAIAPEQLAQALRVRVGDPVKRAAVLAEVAGRPPRSCPSPVSGVVEQIDLALGQIRVREAGRLPPAIPVRLPAAGLLGCPRRSLPALVHRQAGDRVQRGELLAGGYPGPLVHSPATGTLQEIDVGSGEIVIAPARELWQLTAPLPSMVERVIPDQGCLLQCQADTLRGLFRLGGEAHGRLQTLTAANGQPVQPHQITRAMAGQVLALNTPLSGETLHQAQVQGIAAIVAGGARLSELLQATGASPSQAAQTESCGISVLLLAGFGARPMDVSLFSRLESCAGRHAFISGQQPELLVAR